MLGTLTCSMVTPAVADVAHLDQREDTQAEHQQADQREAEQGARGDIHVA
jgi:hypothetical protein